MKKPKPNQPGKAKSIRPKIKVYYDRYDEEYLGHLLYLLQDDNLLKTAVDVPSRELASPDGKKRPYKRISIDFCGAAATTLTGNKTGHEEINNNSRKLREEIRKRFKNILSKKNLAEFNEKHDVYIRIRFLLAYMYAVMPRSMIKAAEHTNWETVTGDYKFHIIPPLTEEQLKGSKIYIAQQKSLSDIVEIVQANPNLIITDGKEQRVNTIQVRFPVIPSATCQLFINGNVFFDNYIYSKAEGDTFLTLNSPICLVKKNEDEKHFKDQKAHFEYLWKHDLTLFCSDATNFTPENPEGLGTIKPPTKDGFEWQHKQRRIEDKLRKNNPEYKSDTERIDAWKKNLNSKVKSYTRIVDEGKSKEQSKTSDIKTIPKQVNTDSKDIEIEVGIKSEKYFYSISVNETLICEKSDKKANLLFCALAHYGYALHKKKTPVMWERYPHNKSKFKTQIISQIRNSVSSAKTKAEDIFDLIFRKDAAGKLCLATGKITIDEKNIEKIRAATYPSKDFDTGKVNKKTPCLDSLEN